MKPLILLLCLTSHALAVTTPESVLRVADQLLELGAVSYVYGGNRIGDIKDCEACSQCLDSKKVPPSARFRSCPTCKACSLDCSHFIQLVYHVAGIKTPYLTTAEMENWSGFDLKRKAGLDVVDWSADSLQAGDLLVYRGHVVLVEKVHPTGRIDLVHATGGRDVKGGGQGIQRERWVDAASFRGPLQRVLRHEKIQSNQIDRQYSPTPPPQSRSRLRPVAKKNPLD